MHKWHLKVISLSSMCCNLNLQGHHDIQEILVHKQVQNNFSFCQIGVHAAGTQSKPNHRGIMDELLWCLHRNKNAFPQLTLV